MLPKLHKLLRGFKENLLAQFQKYMVSNRIKVYTKA